MSFKFPMRSLTACLIAAQILLPLSTQAGISNLPPLAKPRVFPNIIYTLDDSGSMMFEILPVELNIGGGWVTLMFPQPDNVYGGSNYNSNLRSVFGFGNNITVAKARSSVNNPVYYNPNTTYEPWIDVNKISALKPYGEKMAPANKTAALYNPVAPKAGALVAAINLTAVQNANMFPNSNSWLRDDATGLVTGGSAGVASTFYPATYFNYSGAPGCTVNTLGCYTKIEIKPATATYAVGLNTRTDCGANATSCTYDQEIQNFANWFQYYRSRVLLARGSSAKAFAEQGEGMRVGFDVINNTNATLISRVKDDFSWANKKDFITELYTAPFVPNGTPLRRSMDKVGQYFMNYKGTDGPWATKYGVAEVTTQATCRQNFNIMMTDGYWNDGASYEAGSPRNVDFDNTSGSPITGKDKQGADFTYTYAPVLPFKASQGNTLADIAMYYWRTNLRSDWTSSSQMNVQTATNGSAVGLDKDFAFWPHLVQYTVGLGVNGSLNRNTPLTDIAAWPVIDFADGNDDAKIDDLWHAAVNSRGKYFSANNAKDFSAALKAALGEIEERTSSATAVATSSNTIGDNTKIYTSSFLPADWSGVLEQKALDSQGVVLTPNNWDTKSWAPVPSSRGLFTSTSTANSGLKIDAFSSLSTIEQAAFNTSAGTYPVDVVVTGADIFEFIRGDKSKETKPFRTRKYILGDIVNSDPQFVGEGRNEGYEFLTNSAEKAGYKTYLVSKKNRANVAPTVYVASNDGMLHAFDAKADVTAVERFAYIPRVIIPDLPALAKPGYSHRFFVDGTPKIADAAIGPTTALWKTVLLGSTGAGAKAIYALDVTDPANFSANNVMWEKSSTAASVDNDLGYVLGPPQMGRLKDGRWVAIFGNGYGSVNNQAALYVLDLKTGAEIYKQKAVLSGNATANGLSTPKLIIDTDATVIGAYAGDLQGNMWKFTFKTDSSTSFISQLMPAGSNLTTPLFAPTSSSVDDARPITTQPQIVKHPTEGNIVVFGTGKIFEENDTASTKIETLYGIWDKKVWSTSVRPSNLLQQDLSKIGFYYYDTNKPIDWQIYSGWKVLLNIAGGERLVTDPIVFEDQVIFTTLLPTDGSNPCAGGGLTTTLQISPFNGGRLGYKTFDEPGSGNGASEVGASGKTSPATLGTTIIKMGGGVAKFYQQNADGGSVGGGAADNKRNLSKRVSTVRLWRQILGKE
ncbi:MAG: hypothetical protein K2P84_03315 [Undibacterium sp.]|nr:hypothetical protein [Undibacterium sp.]